MQDMFDDKKVEARPDFDLNDFAKVVVPRGKLITWLDLPIWNKAIEGVYVKIRASSTTGGQMYQIGKINGMEVFVLLM